MDLNLTLIHIFAFTSQDEDVAVSFSRVHHAGSPVKVDGQTILSPVVNSVDRSRHGEICDQDLKVSGLLREVEMLREQVSQQYDF